jgi:hypothetical protein
VTGVAKERKVKQNKRAETAGRDSHAVTGDQPPLSEDVDIRSPFEGLRKEKRTGEPSATRSRERSTLEK